MQYTERESTNIYKSVFPTRSCRPAWHYIHLFLTRPGWVPAHRKRCCTSQLLIPPIPLLLFPFDDNFDDCDQRERKGRRGMCEREAPITICLCGWACRPQCPIPSHSSLCLFHHPPRKERKWREIPLISESMDFNLSRIQHKKSGGEAPSSSSFQVPSFFLVSAYK